MRITPPFLLPLVERIEASSTNRRLATGTFWSLLGAFFARFLSVLAAVVAARCLGKETFGQLGIIQSTILNLSIFTSYSIGLTATKHIAELRINNPDRASRVIALSGATSLVTSSVLSLGLYFGSDWLAAHTLAAPELGQYLKIGALILFFINQNGAQIGALAGFEAFKIIARINLITGILTFLAMTVGVLFAGLTGAVCGLAGANAISWVVTHFAMRRVMTHAGIAYSMKGLQKELPVLWNFSLPAALGSMLFGPVSWACCAILVNQPGGYAEMGYFNAINQWFALAMFIPGLLGQVVLPMLSASIGKRDWIEARNILWLAVKINGMIALVLVVIVTCLSPFLMSLYGEGFRGAWPSLVISMVTAGVLAVQAPLGEVLNADGRPRIMLGINVIWAAVILPLTYLLAAGGVLGVVTARLVAFVAKGICLLGVLRPLLRESNP